MPINIGDYIKYMLQKRNLELVLICINIWIFERIKAIMTLNRERGNGLDVIYIPTDGAPILQFYTYSTLFVQGTKFFNKTSNNSMLYIQIQINFHF